MTAVLCGGLPAIALVIFLPIGFGKWLAGFVAGFLWASWFEYAYHRFLLHLPGTFFARRHLEHHASVGTPTEAEHVNFGSSPIWVVALFAINSLLMVAVNLLLRLGIAPGILLAFAVYYIAVEEVHWRIHLGEMAAAEISLGTSVPPGAPHVSERTVQHLPATVGCVAWTV